MECKYKKVLLVNPDGTKVCVCSCTDSAFYGREPECKKCKKNA